MRESLVAAAITLVVYVLLHILGIGMVVDGWAAWQGAVSIASGRGYTYLSGEPVRAWAPLYSLYMAAWFFFTGPVGWGLIAANAMLIAAQGFCWHRLARVLSVDSDLSFSPLPSYTIALFLGLFLNATQWQVFGHNLVYVLLPLFLVCLWRLVGPARSSSSWRELAIAIALGTALMLTHNSCVAFVAIAAAMIVLRRPRWKISVLQAFLLVAIPGVIWQLARDSLGQAGSHPIGLGKGQYRFWEYVAQLIQGSGKLLVPDLYFAPFVVVALLTIGVALLFGNKKAAALRFGVIFAMGSLTILLAIFNLTWVANELGGRFLIYIPLLVLPPLFMLARERTPEIAMAAALLFLVPQAYWVANWGVRQIRQTLDEQGFPHSFALPNVYLSHSYLTGPPIRTAKGIMVSPLAFVDPAGKKASDIPSTQ